MKSISSFRNATPAQLTAALLDARNYTLTLFERLAAAGMDDPARVPYLKIINPPLWELGHLAWFAEWFTLREAQPGLPAVTRYPSLLHDADAYFDSGTVAHATRWQLNLPPLKIIKTFAENVLDRILENLARADNSDETLYPFRLVLAHEDMHGEACYYTLQTLGIAPPNVLMDAYASSFADHPSAISPAPEIAYAGGEMYLGSQPNNGFVFDNEKWAHRVNIAPFCMDAALVTNQQYAEFIVAGGYQQHNFWSTAGAAWLSQSSRSAPRYWKHHEGKWQTQNFDKWVALSPNQAVRHINLFEAQAYCTWAGRRLPIEAEWECAAKLNHAHSSLKTLQWGELWEWTQSPFAPYPEFSADIYQNYSSPWFDTHQVLRGASFATQTRMRSATYRNFFTPERDDIFSGFRTCAIES